MQKFNRFAQSFDRFLHESFENQESKKYVIMNDLVVILTVVSVISVVLSSVEAIYSQYKLFFDISEWVIVGVFTFEYLANIYVAKNKREYIFGLWGIIDLLAILPFYLNQVDLRSVKVLRVMRILRFLRLMRMLKLAKKAVHEYKLSKAQKFNTLKMDIQIYFLTLFSVVIISSTFMFYAEKDVPGTTFTNIPNAMWWCIVTITTVGYGDMYPVTILGRCIASVTMLAGLALFGLLTNVIGKSMMSSLFGVSDINGKVDQTELKREIKKQKKGTF